MEPATREAPAGSKGTVTEISALVITSLLSAGTITALSRVLIARIKAGTATKFVITDGDRSLQVNKNTSAEETQLLLEKFNG